MKHDLPLEGLSAYELGRIAAETVYQRKEDEMAQTVEMKDGEIVKVEEAPGLQNWKTFIFGLLIIALGAVDATNLATVIPAPYVGVVLVGIGMAIVWLRTQTSGPMLSNVKVKVVS